MGSCRIPQAPAFRSATTVSCQQFGQRDNPVDGVDLALRDLERNGRIELLKLVICGRVAHQLLYKHMLYFGGNGTRINFSDQSDNDIIPNRGSAARNKIDKKIEKAHG